MITYEGCKCMSELNCIDDMFSGYKVFSYDYILVGAGLFNAALAACLHDKNPSAKILVIEKRSTIGGNCFTENIDGIDVHKYGAHIFHTSDKHIWEFVNRFSEFNSYRHNCMAKSNGKIYNLPFNMNTFCQLWRNISTPDEAKFVISNEIKEYFKDINHCPENLEEKAISLVGKTIYETFIKGYTEKQWGKLCSELSPDIISRIPVRYTFDNNYFFDDYQGIPVSGYTKMIQRMFDYACAVIIVDRAFDETHLAKLFSNPYYKNAKIIYTGPIDEFCNYSFGPLEWRSLKFKTKTFKTDNYQGAAVVNYTDSSVAFTRKIEHKWFNPKSNAENTIVTTEYPENWSIGKEPYYSVNNKETSTLYSKYVGYIKEKYNDFIIFAGRLGQYRYFDMDDTIEEAIKLAASI